MIPDDRLLVQIREVRIRKLFRSASPVKINDVPELKGVFREFEALFDIQLRVVWGWQAKPLLAAACNSQHDAGISL